MSNIRDFLNLIKDARTSAEWKGHAIKGFTRQTHNGILIYQADSECSDCKMEVQVILKPKANEIDIGGEAIALTCPR